MIGFSCMDFKTTCMDQSISLDLEEKQLSRERRYHQLSRLFLVMTAKALLYRSERISMEAYRPRFSGEV